MCVCFRSTNTFDFEKRAANGHWLVYKVTYTCSRRSGLPRHVSSATSAVYICADSDSCVVMTLVSNLNDIHVGTAGTKNAGDYKF